MDSLFIDFLKFEGEEYYTDILKKYTAYINDNAYKHCLYCIYDTCSEHDSCTDGIFEYLKSKINK